jgi:hypothetical protein
MKTSTKAFITAAIVLAASQAIPAHAGVNFNLSIGVPVVAAVPPPLPIPAPPRAIAGPAPEFIFSPSLGFYVSVRTPVDVFYTGGNYYRYDRGNWYASSRYNGAWRRADHRGLPPDLAKHSYEQLRDYRDRDYRNYMNARNHGLNNGHNDYRVDRQRPGRDRFEQDARGYGERRM